MNASGSVLKSENNIILRRAFQDQAGKWYDLTFSLGEGMDVDASLAHLKESGTAEKVARLMERCFLGIGTKPEAGEGAEFRVYRRADASPGSREDVVSKVVRGPLRRNGNQQQSMESEEAIEEAPEEDLASSPDVSGCLKEVFRYFIPPMSARSPAPVRSPTSNRGMATEMETSPTLPESPAHRPVEEDFSLLTPPPRLPPSGVEELLTPPASPAHRPVEGDPSSLTSPPSLPPSKVEEIPTSPASPGRPPVPALVEGSPALRATVRRDPAPTSVSRPPSRDRTPVRYYENPKGNEEAQNRLRLLKGAYDQWMAQQADWAFWSRFSLEQILFPEGPSSEEDCRKFWEFFEFCLCNEEFIRNFYAVQMKDPLSDEWIKRHAESPVENSPLDTIRVAYYGRCMRGFFLSILDKHNSSI